MKVKRVKHARKYLTLFKNSFGIFEPYQILVDGTFCQAALQTKINIKEQLPKYLDGIIQLFTLTPFLGVPLLFINHNTILLEKPSSASCQASDKVQISRLEPSKHEKETLEKLSETSTELKPRRKGKRPGGPNPLSVLKSKKRKDDRHKGPEDIKKKRIRKRKRKVARHVLEAIQDHAATTS
ncbi:rRNA-processing protein UTP23 homolog [Porites lutea]|uniref:rRNA-processing protein UTP23 homolog n=1 Tax=Porites lutea TaxID=51062 RepID=UPI003CC5C115